MRVIINYTKRRGDDNEKTVKSARGEERGGGAGPFKIWMRIGVGGPGHEQSCSRRRGGRAATTKMADGGELVEDVVEGRGV